MYALYHSLLAIYMTGPRASLDHNATFLQLSNKINAIISKNHFFQQVVIATFNTCLLDARPIGAIKMSLRSPVETSLCGVLIGALTTAYHIVQVAMRTPPLSMVSMNAAAPEIVTISVHKAMGIPPPCIVFIEIATSITMVLRVAMCILPVSVLSMEMAALETVVRPAALCSKGVSVGKQTRLQHIQAQWRY